MNGGIVTLTGPSASGKTTLESLLCDTSDSIFHRVVSTTTRAPRPGEVESRAYHFVDAETFERMFQNDEFMECVEFGGNRYGATKAEFRSIFDQGKVAVIVCEPIGRAQIEKKASRLDWDTLSVFVTNPPRVRFQRLLDRLLGEVILAPERAHEYRDRLAQRLETIFTVESWWEDDAWQYDIVIKEFHKQNQASVVDHVKGSVMKMLHRESIGALTHP